MEYQSRFSEANWIDEDNFFNDDFYFSTSENFVDFSLVYFDNVVLDFKNIWLVGVHLEGLMFFSKNETCSNLTLQFSNSLQISQMEWCESASSEKIFSTPDLTSLLSHLLKTVSYTVPMTIIVKIDDVALQPGSVLKVEYKLPKPGKNFNTILLFIYIFLNLFFCKKKDFNAYNNDFFFTVC